MVPSDVLVIVCSDYRNISPRVVVAKGGVMNGSCAGCEGVGGWVREPALEDRI